MRSFAQAILIAVAATALGAIPLLAQRSFGVSHTYGGSRVVAPRVPGTQPLGGGRPFPIRGIGPPPLGLRAPAAPGFTGINPGALKSSSHYRHDYRRVPQAYFFAPYYYPFLGYSDSSYDAYPPYDAAQDPNVQSAEVTANMLGQQIQNLSAQIDQLRMDKEAARNQRAQSPDVPTPAQQEAAPPSPPIKLVLRTGQQIQVQDYAVVDGTFWDFTNQATRKIPISNIDIPASQKATEDAGAEFPQLGK